MTQTVLIVYNKINNYKQIVIVELKEYSFMKSRERSKGYQPVSYNKPDYHRINSGEIHVSWDYWTNENVLKDHIDHM